MFNQLIQYFHDHFENILPTIQVSGWGRMIGFQIGGECGTIGVYTSTTQARSEVKAISESLQSLYLRLAANNMYDYAIQYDCEREKRKVTNYLNSSDFKRLKSQWSKFGIHELTSLDEAVKQDHVGIYIERDEQNLVCRLKVASNFFLHRANFNLELTQAPADVERIKKFNLTYLKDWVGFDQQWKSLADKIKNANNNQRLELLNQFNEQWKGQLTATLTYIADSNERVLALTEVSGMELCYRRFCDLPPLFKALQGNPPPLIEEASPTSTPSERVAQAFKENAGLIFGISLTLASEYLGQQYIKNDRLLLMSQGPRIVLFMYGGVRLQQWIDNKPQEPAVHAQPNVGLTSCL